MNNLKRGFLIIISSCMLLTQSMLVTAAPMKMPISSVTVPVAESQTEMSQSMGCHQPFDEQAAEERASSQQHACCQQDCEEHQCSGECGQCLASGTGANLPFNTDLLNINLSHYDQFAYLSFFYHFRPDNGLRPPIA